MSLETLIRDRLRSRNIFRVSQKTRIPYRTLRNLLLGHQTITLRTADALIAELGIIAGETVAITDERPYSPRRPKETRRCAPPDS